MLEQINCAIKKHHGLTLFLLCAKDKELSTFYRCVIVQSWELKWDTCISAPLTSFNFCPTLINHIFISWDFCCCRELHHHIVQGTIDLLLDIFDRLVETHSLTLF